MPRQCLTCVHEDREEVETALRSGDRPGIVAEKFPELSEAAIRRHSAHMDRDSTAIVVRGDQSVLANAVNGAGLVNELSNLYAEATAVGLYAMHRGNDNVSLKALQSKLSIIESVRKLGEAEKSSADSAANASAGDDLRKIIAALRVVLPDYPQAGAALAQQLENVNEWAAASSVRQLSRKI